MGLLRTDSQRQADAIRGLVDSPARNLVTAEYPSTIPSVSDMFVCIVKTAVTIATESGGVITAGTGTVTPYSRNRTSNNLEVVSGYDDIRVYNHSTDFSYAIGDYVLVDQHYMDGDYYVVSGGVGTLWGFTLNANMSSSTAAADKLTVAGVDTGVDIYVKDTANLFMRALNGASGLCVEILGSFYVLECQTKAGWVKFTLTGSAGTFFGSSNVATRNDYGGSQQDVQDPGSTITVHNGSGLFNAAISGCVGLAFYDAIDDEYIAVECQTKAGWIRFALTADMSGSSAACTVLDHGGSQNDVYFPGSTTTVHDDAGNFPLALDTATGEAIYDIVDDRYRIVSCNQQALRLQALVDESSDVATDREDFQVDTLVVASPRPFSMLPPTYVDATTELTVLNRYKFKLDDDAEVDIYYTGSAWVCVQGTCPTP